MKDTIRKQIENRLLKYGQVDNWTMIDERMTTRLGGIINQMRNDGWKIVTEFDPHKSKNCFYKLSPEHYRKVVINGGVTSYFEKI